MLSAPARWYEKRAWCSRGALLLLAACCLGPLVPAAEPPSKGAAGPPAPAGPTPAARPVIHSLDDLKKLPGGPVLIITDDPQEGQRLIPRGVMMSPEEYQNLLAEIERLKAQPSAKKPESVIGSCELKGQVKENLVHFQGVFKVPRDHANTLVALGCNQALPTEASLDGHLPLLQIGADGFVFQVSTPDEHTLTFDFDVPLTVKGGERGFDLDLPHAGITLLDLELPDASIKEVHQVVPDAPGGREVKPLAVRILDGKPRLQTLLGPLGRLELSWKGAAPRPEGPADLTADSRLTVHVRDKSVWTQAQFTLKTLRGQESQWRLLLPPGAQLAVPPHLPDDRLEAEEIDKKDPRLHTLRLKAPSADPLTVTYQVTQPRTEATLPLGPFVVLGAFPQQCSLLVNASPDLRVTPQVPHEPLVLLRARDLTEKERDGGGVAAFTCSMLLPPDLKGPAPQPLPPFLHLEVETVQGGSATRTLHTVQLTEQGWRLLTEIDVTPLRAGGIDRLEVQLPPGYEDPHRAARPGTAEYRLEVDGASATATLFLPVRKTESFRVALEGMYPAAGTTGHQVNLELPRPKKTVDRGGAITVMLPRDLELTKPNPPEPAWEDLQPGATQHSWSMERMPERVVIAWRVPHPEVAPEATVNVTLGVHQAQVEERLTYPFPAPPSQIVLLVPEAVGLDQVRLGSDRATFLPAVGPAVAVKPPAGFRAWPLLLAAPLNPDHPLILNYSFPLPEPDPATHARRFAVPLILPEQAAQAGSGIDTRLRIWGTPGADVALVGDSPWEEAARDLGDRDTLPARVLHGRRLDLPPRLRLTDPAAFLATVFVKRALVQAAVAEGGTQTYRARFLIDRLLAPQLDVEFPAPPTNLNLKVHLQVDGETRTVPYTVVDDTGQPAEGGRVARLALGPDLVHQPVVLEMTYWSQVPPGRNQGGGLGQSTLSPPRLLGDVVPFPVRFQVRLPSDWVPLYLAREGDLALEQRWGWRGWLLAPRPAVSSADLESWFREGLPPAGGASEALPRDTDSASLVCWRDNLEPLRITHVPQQAWLLLCSLTLLFVGLGVYLLALVLARRSPGRGTEAGEGTGLRGRRLSAVWLWTAAVTLALVICCLLLLWPGVLGPVLYGCEPGALVLAAVLSVQWMLHQRYRRQVVFLPGFTRMKPGSSLIRGKPGVRAREPSTVDGPTSPGGASHEPSGKEPRVN